MQRLTRRVPCVPCRPRRPRRPRLLRPLLALCAVLLLPACSSLQPWVQPYERERLADPILQWQRHALADKHREHIHAVREGARGATGVQGGGCGCN